MEAIPLKTEEIQEVEEDFSDITLRRFDLSDINNFMVWVTDDKVSKFCSWETYTSKEAAIKYMEEVILPHPWFKAICLNNRPIGAISVARSEGYDRCRGEVGYVLASKYWGKGIMTRALNMLVKTIFVEWPDLERLEALVDVENSASMRVLEKGGFEREGILRKYVVLKGRARDMVMFSFLSTDVQKHNTVISS